MFASRQKKKKKLRSESQYYINFKKLFTNDQMQNLVARIAPILEKN